MSRTRVAPIRTLIIPHLELLGALVLASLMNSVQKCFHQSHIIVPPSATCWTDSMTVIHWIRQQKLWPTFVRNRVDEIRTLLPPECWQFCPGSNPADISSRGVTPVILQQSTLWWNGPPWLSSPMNLWPAAVLAEEEPTSENDHEYIENVCATISDAENFPS